VPHSCNVLVLSDLPLFDCSCFAQHVASQTNSDQRHIRMGSLRPALHSRLAGRGRRATGLRSYCANCVTQPHSICTCFLPHPQLSCCSLTLAVLWLAELLATGLRWSCCA
jgi:hypothetical protein